MRSATSQVRRAGRGLIFALYGALRAVKLYPVENAAVQKALGDVTAQARGLIELAGELELRMSGEFIFVNETRLRLDLDNFASFSHLLALFRGAGIGSITLGSTVEAKDWLIFLSLLQSPSTDDPAARFDQLVEKLSGAGVSAFSLTVATDQHDDDLEKNEGAREAHVRAVRRRDAGPDDVGAHGCRREHQEDQARRAGHRRSNPERGDVAHRVDDVARLRRVHVHA